MRKLADPSRPETQGHKEGQAAAQDGACRDEAGRHAGGRQALRSCLACAPGISWQGPTWVGVQMMSTGTSCGAAAS